LIWRNRKGEHPLFPRAPLFCLLVHQLVWQPSPDPDEEDVWYCEQCKKVYHDPRKTNVDV
jgi:hypothetical protein